MDNKNKSNVGDVTIIKDCMICHTESILIALKNNTILPEKDSIMPVVCKECSGKYLTEGVLLINPDNGAFVVIRDDAFSRLFKGTPIPSGKICYTEQAVLNLITEMSNNVE